MLGCHESFSHSAIARLVQGLTTLALVSTAILTGPEPSAIRNTCTGLAIVSVVNQQAW